MKKHFGIYNRSNTTIPFDKIERNALIYLEYTTKIIEVAISKTIKKDYKLFSQFNIKTMSKHILKHNQLNISQLHIL